VRYKIVEDKPHGWTESGVERTHTRLHLSEIIDAVDTELCISPWNKPNATEKKVDLWACADLGFSFEVMLEWAFKQRMVEFDCSDVVRLPEIERSDIVCSPDGFQKKARVLHEYKLRWKSSNNFKLEEEWKILTQIKGYLMALKDSPWCAGELPTNCYLWVLFVMGDYRGTFPILRCYDIEFTHKEIWDTWLMLTRFAKDANMWKGYETDENL